MTSSGENVQLVAKHAEGVAIMQCGRKMKPGNSVSPARHSLGIQYSHSGDSFFPAQLISEMELPYDFKFVQDKCSVEDCRGLEICFKVDTGVTSDDFSN